MFWRVHPTLAHVPSVATITERIIISNYCYNKICDEHMVDMLLPLNTIDEFLISRFIDIKRVQYKDVTLLQTYYCQNPMTATQTHSHIIVLLVHQVIMIIYK
jgi:hypothetical protein